MATTPKTTVQIRVKRMRAEEEKSTTITYNAYPSRFGNILLASTHAGICYAAFGQEEVTENELRQRYPQARFVKGEAAVHDTARTCIADFKQPAAISLHIKATDFQWDVWNALLCIPQGKTSTYGTIANAIRRPRAVRAVGTAVGQNPVSYFIPCHRVIRTDGSLGGYHWGIELKKELLHYESK